MAIADNPVAGIPNTSLALTLITLLGGTVLIAVLPFTAPLIVGWKSNTGANKGRLGKGRPSALNYEEECRAKLAQVPECWQKAESAVLQLDDNHPLRTLLEKELSSVGWRLSMYPCVEPTQSGALTNGHISDYWRSLNRQVSQAVRELRRVNAPAEAGRESVGTQSSLPQMPRTADEAYFVLGVNSDVTDETLKRLIRALRQCWHPDLAQNTSEREYREARIRQINVANDLIAKHWQTLERIAS